MRPVLPRLGVPVLAAATLAVALAACGGGGRATSGSPAGGSPTSAAGGAGPLAGQTITLYNGQHEQTTQGLVSGFERQTGVHVRERDGDEDALAGEIEQEGSASPADVFYTENSPALMSLQERSLLAPLPASITDQVPAADRSPRSDWVGVSARYSAMVYNPSKLSPAQLPKSVMDLADPQWKGKLALAPTETDFLPVVVSVAHAKGQAAALAWLKALKANSASHREPDNETVTADVNNGQAAIGLIDHYYWYRLSAELGPAKMHSRLAFFAAGDPGFVMDVSGAGVLASSKHKAAADALVAYLVSAGGQSALVHSDSFEYPIRPGVAPAAGESPMADLHPIALTVEQLGDGKVALDLLQEAQLV